MTDHAPPALANFAGWLDQSNTITKAFLAAKQIPGMINIAGGLPDPQVYPSAQIAEIAARAVIDFPAETLGYGPLDGLPELRTVIAERYSNDRLHLTADNVLITTSGMQGLDLIGKVLLDEGDVVAGQFPTYLGALDAWRPRKPTYRKLLLQSNALEFTDVMRGAKFAYTVPNFSNPTGRLVPESTRLALVDAARATGAWLVEDDPYGGLNYDGPLPPLMLTLSAQRPGARAAAAYDGPIIYLGTLSKLLAPGLRIGWVIASPRIIEALTLAKQGSDMCTSGLNQRMALEILKAGLIESCNPTMLTLYRRRRDALCAALQRDLSPWFDWNVPEGGMFVWLTARDQQLNTNDLFKTALEELVCVSPSSVFDAEGIFQHGLRLNFTLNDEATLDEAVRRLARATKRHLTL